LVSSFLKWLHKMSWRQCCV